MNAIKSMNLWANQLSHEPLPVKRQTLPAGESALWKYNGGISCKPTSTSANGAVSLVSRWQDK